MSDEVRELGVNYANAENSMRQLELANIEGQRARSSLELALPLSHGASGAVRSAMAALDGEMDRNNALIASMRRYVGEVRAWDDALAAMVATTGNLRIPQTLTEEEQLLAWAYDRIKEMIELESSDIEAANAIALEVYKELRKANRDKLPADVLELLDLAYKIRNLGFTPEIENEGLRGFCKALLGDERAGHSAYAGPPLNPITSTKYFSGEGTRYDKMPATYFRAAAEQMLRDGYLHQKATDGYNRYNEKKEVWQIDCTGVQRLAAGSWFDPDVYTFYERSGPLNSKVEHLYAAGMSRTSTTDGSSAKPVKLDRANPPIDGVYYAFWDKKSPGDGKADTHVVYVFPELTLPNGTVVQNAAFQSVGKTGDSMYAKPITEGGSNQSNCVLYGIPIVIDNSK